MVLTNPGDVKSWVYVEANVCLVGDVGQRRVRVLQNAGQGHGREHHAAHNQALKKYCAATALRRCTQYAQYNSKPIDLFYALYILLVQKSFEEQKWHNLC